MEGFAGLFTGLIVGDVPLGLAIGGTLELMSFGRTAVPLFPTT